MVLPVLVTVALSAALMVIPFASLAGDVLARPCDLTGAASFIAGSTGGRPLARLAALTADA